MRYADVLGRENVIAGVDCGFGTSAQTDQVDSEVAWASSGHWWRGRTWLPGHSGHIGYCVSVGCIAQDATTVVITEKVQEREGGTTMTDNTRNPTRRHAPTRQRTLTPYYATMLLIPQRAGALARMGRSPNFTAPAMNRPASTQVRRSRSSPRGGRCALARPRSSVPVRMNSQGMQARAGATC